MHTSNGKVINKKYCISNMHERGFKSKLLDRSTASLMRIEAGYRQEKESFSACFLREPTESEGPRNRMDLF